MQSVLRMSTSKSSTIIACAFVAVLLAVSYFSYKARDASHKPADKAVFKSIAVLPFVNMTNNSAEDYLCDGLTDGILNSIARLEGIKVSARTSSFKFRGKEIDIKEVGKKLGVETV